MKILNPEATHPPKIQLPEKVRTIIRELEDHGFEAFAVGGCVRDSLLGRAPEDWDITTNALPQEVKSIFPHTIDTGIEHGTVTVMLNHEGFEVTTYRIDGEYEDARHPKQVSFTSQLTEDLRRRDFTINAMAYSDSAGLIDVFGGRGDMEARVIRCVGDPDERFDEDALRIMRAVRFSAQLDFTIEPRTLRAISTHAAELSRISAERIRVELTKLLISSHPERLFTAYETGLTAVFLPEFDRMLDTPQENPHHCYDVGWHTLHALMHDANRLKNVPSRADQADNTQKALSETSDLLHDKKSLTALRYAILLHDIAKPCVKTFDTGGVAHFYKHQALGADMARDILRRLKFDNETIHTVTHLIALHDYRYGAGSAEISERTMRHAIHRIGKDYLGLLFLLQEADLHAQSPERMPEKLAQLAQARVLAKQVLHANQCVSLKDLAINGKDLITQGFAPGPTLGAVLDTLLQHVLEIPEDNKPDILLALAKKSLQSDNTLVK